MLAPFLVSFGLANFRLPVVPVLPVLLVDIFILSLLMCAALALGCGWFIRVA